MKEAKLSKLSFLVNNSTVVKLKNAVSFEKQENKEEISYFFGYQQELKDLKQSIAHSLFQREELVKNGLGPLKGILISGFSGAGKSALLK